MNRLLRSSVAVSMLAVGVGCGATTSQQEPDELDSRQDALFPCNDNESWHVEYYSDESRTVWVGADDCNCDGQQNLFGHRSIYSQTIFWPTACVEQ
ncbi:hypothetical protein HUW62_04515 [Myxococcus sp. AM011]|uniref:hypothetical protein n=1 Tax=Myxococcus sp. AM011 TaxID=2745200 RepID=UPI0015958133|nr:hypothetical protein [Myxococcus sp. AM011]NVJ20485.1 hypothetical protein [Myxococcus sp. AM011]